MCKVCGSWKLGTVGIGIDLIDQKIKDRFPEVKVFRIDSDTTKTEKKVIDTIAQFYSSPGSILLGTEMALKFDDSRVTTPTTSASRRVSTWMRSAQLKSTQPMNTMRITQLPDRESA